MQKNVQKFCSSIIIFMIGQGAKFCRNRQIRLEISNFGKKQKIIDEKCTKMSMEFL